MYFNTILIGDFMKYFIVFSRTIMVLMGIFLYYWFLYRRKNRKLNVLNLMLIILMVGIGVISISNYQESFFLTIGPFLVIILGSLLINREKFRKKDEIVTIIDRGKVNFCEMLKRKISLEELLFNLNEEGVRNIEDVDYAILEEGKIYILKKNSVGTYPLPIIINGQIDYGVLGQIGKDEEWLRNTSRDLGYSLKDIFYGFFINDQIFLIDKGKIK